MESLGRLGRAADSLLRALAPKEAAERSRILGDARQTLSVLVQMGKSELVLFFDKPHVDVVPFHIGISRALFGLSGPCSKAFGMLLAFGIYHLRVFWTYCSSVLCLFDLFCFAH